MELQTSDTASARSRDSRAEAHADLGRLIAACESEQIHLLGATQSWGALLIADADGRVVRHASANLASFLAIDAAEALGRDLTAVIGPDACAELLSAGDGAGSLLAAPVPGRADLTVSGYRAGGQLHVEIEPRGAGIAGVEAAGGPMRRTVEALRRSPDMASLFTVAIAETRRLIGFDQVIVYRFEPDGHGIVLAEDRAAHVPSLLGLHFPAIDVPPQARHIFARLWVRLIGDTHAAPVPLLGPRPGGTPPDLSLAALRSPSPCHLEYLRNMGSHATLTVPLHVDGALWGLLAAHHRTAAHVPAGARARCELIGQITSIMVAPLRDAAGRADTMARRSRAAGIARRLSERQADPAHLAATIVAEGDDLLALCDATGVIVRLGGQVTTYGEAPAGAPAAALVDALFARAPDDGTIFASDAVGERLDEAPGDPSANAADRPAGALLLPVTLAKGDAIVWLRPEQARIVDWGGDPNRPMDQDSESGRLVPRGSFAAWRQEVRGRSRPWRDEDVRSADALRRRLDAYLAGYAESMRVARDEADRASRAKSEFLATMSHEIRSPISGLLGVLELLRGTNLDAEQTRMAEMVNNSATMLLAVLNDILDFSKIEAGALSIQSEPVAPRRLLEELVQPHALSAARKGLAVRLSVDPAVPAWISTDALRLRQIVGNLLSNAIKFTASGEIVMTVGRASGADGAPMLSFAVSDTGIGMNAEVLARLFNPFTQADGSTTRNFGGTGLGLSISRKLARLLGGDLVVTSQVGVGSVFTLHVPMVACESDQGTRAAPETAATSTPSGRRVLVVDDDATIRWLSQRQLEKLGFQVVVAENGEIGLRKFREGRFDLLLTDCHMPIMDGVTLTRAVRADADSALRAVPIVGLTADVTEAQRDSCAQAGMSELAIKPLTVDRLAQLMARHLAHATDAAPESAPPPSPPAGEEAGLRAVAFDPEIYLSIFPPGDPDGAAWLGDYLAAARADADDLIHRLAGESGAACPRDDVKKVAHRLAGSSFSAGAMLLGTAARALERAVLANASEDALADLGIAVGHAMTDAEAAIAAFLALAPESATALP